MTSNKTENYFTMGTSAEDNKFIRIVENAINTHRIEVLNETNIFDTVTYAYKEI